MNDETTENPTNRTIWANVSWWDVRLHQLFCLVAFSAIVATWIATPTITWALAVLLYLVTIPVLAGFYVLTWKSGDQLPIPRTVVVGALLGTSLSWAITTFVLDDADLVVVVPLAFLLLSFGVIGWNVLRT